MRKRTIRSGKDYIKLLPILGTVPLLRLIAYDWMLGRATDIPLTRSQVEKLRDALTDWLESGAK